MNRLSALTIFALTVLIEASNAQVINETEKNDTKQTAVKPDGYCLGCSAKK
jgi:hypothetical protein